MTLSDLISKRVSGVRTSNLKDDEVDELTITFDDGTELILTNEYLEGYGWTTISIRLDHRVP